MAACGPIAGGPLLASKNGLSEFPCVGVDRCASSTARIVGLIPPRRINRLDDQLDRFRFGVEAVGDRALYREREAFA